MRNKDSKLIKMAIMLFNTLKRKKEEFIPQNKNIVKIYVCGPTVYDHCHIGHAKTAVAFDVIRQFLKFRGYSVYYISNITDVGHIVGDADEGEDKIEKRAKERQKDPMELVDFYTKSMLEDYDALKIERPNIIPRPTGHMIEIIDFVKELINLGFAYEANGSVYFDIDRFVASNPNTDFGKLSLKKLEKLKSGTRIEINTDKKNDYDFALWKKAEPNHLMKWSSPWGKGFPGWHIECSVMSMKYLGETLDIHGGAIELAQLHHECEIAQSEALSGKKFVNYWLHTGVLMVNDEKMSKSLGNFVTIKDLLKKYSPEAIRMLIMLTHYRSPLNYTENSIKDAQNALDRLNNFSYNIEELARNNKETNKNAALSEYVSKTKAKFESSMDDDFNTPEALASVFLLISEANKYMANKGVSKTNADEILSFLHEFNDIFKILTPKKEQEINKEAMETLLDIRRQLRENKNFETSDRIRDVIKLLGFNVEDTDKGIKVR